MNELKRCTFMVVPSYESVPAVHRIGARLVFQEGRSRAAAGMVHAIKMRCVRRKVLLVSSERRTATLRLRQSLLVAYRVFGDFRLLRGAHWSIAHLSGRALGHRSVGSVPHRGGIAQHRSAALPATRQKGCAGHAQKITGSHRENCEEQGTLSSATVTMVRSHRLQRRGKVGGFVVSEIHTFQYLT